LEISEFIFVELFGERGFRLFEIASEALIADIGLLVESQRHVWFGRLFPDDFGSETLVGLP
jgi:hypothetical protein